MVTYVYIGDETYQVDTPAQRREAGALMADPNFPVQEAAIYALPCSELPADDDPVWASAVNTGRALLADGSIVLAR